MNCSIPDEIEQQLAARASVRRMTTDALVVEALTWYLQREESPTQAPAESANALDTFRKLQESAGVTRPSAEQWKTQIVQGRR